MTLVFRTPDFMASSIVLDDDRVFYKSVNKYVLLLLRTQECHSLPITEHVDYVWVIDGYRIGWILAMQYRLHIYNSQTRTMEPEVQIPVYFGKRMSRTVSPYLARRKTMYTPHRVVNNKLYFLDVNQFTIHALDMTNRTRNEVVEISNTIKDFVVSVYGLYMAVTTKDHENAIVFYRFADPKMNIVNHTKKIDQLLVVATRYLLIVSNDRVIMRDAQTLSFIWSTTYPYVSEVLLLNDNQFVVDGRDSIYIVDIQSWITNTEPKQRHIESDCWTLCVLNGKLHRQSPCLKQFTLVE